MTMTAAELGATISALWKDATVEWARLRTIQRKLEGKNVRTWMPANADAEYKDLFRKSSSPWPEFAQDVMAQGVSIDGYTDAELYQQAWMKSGMEGRQSLVNRQAIGLGYGYVGVLPHDDEDRVVMRAMSSHKTFAVYANPWDDHPTQVLHLVSGTLQKPDTQRWLYIDDVEIYDFAGDARAPRDIKVQEHGLDHAPVSRITATFDDEPRSIIAPAFPIYGRIVDGTFTLQMVQRYGAFPQKFMGGGKLGEVRVAIDSLIHAEGEEGENVRFGTFEAADLEKVVKALQEHLIEFFSFLHIPPIYGPVATIANVSAEATATLEAGYFRNIAELRKPIAEGYDLAFRDAAAMLGRAEPADGAKVSYSDIQTRSLGQATDAIQKLMSAPDGKQPPLEMLFALIPGWSAQDAIEAATAARDVPSPATGQSGIDAVVAVRAQAEALGILVRAGVDPEEAAARVGLTGIDFTGAIPTALRPLQTQARALEQ